MKTLMSILKSITLQVSFVQFYSFNELHESSTKLSQNDRNGKIVKIPNYFTLRYLRQLVISEACELRYSHCLQRATELYSQVMAADDFLENM